MSATVPADSAQAEIEICMVALKDACKKNGWSFTGCASRYGKPGEGSSHFSTSISVPQELASDRGMFDHVVLDHAREIINMWSKSSHSHPPTEAAVAEAARLM
jgi:uncharacterized protein (UPF0210 family)